MDDEVTREMLIAYHRCRQLLGYLGLSLPLLLIAGGWLLDFSLLPSVSDYYHSTLRDLFVGALFATGIVLCTQPRRRRMDGIVPLSGIAALGVALFPNEGGAGVDSLMRSLIGTKSAAMGHYLAAVLFLGGLAYLCLIRFPENAAPKPCRIFRICGWLIVCGGVAATLASAIKLTGPTSAQQFVITHNMVFWIEALGIWAFGLSWLIKDHCEMAALRRTPRIAASSFSRRAISGPDETRHKTACSLTGHSGTAHISPHSYLRPVAARAQ